MYCALSEKLALLSPRQPEEMRQASDTAAQCQRMKRLLSSAPQSELRSPLLLGRATATAQICVQAQAPCCLVPPVPHQRRCGGVRHARQPRETHRRSRCPYCRSRKTWRPASRTLEVPLEGLLSSCLEFSTKRLREWLMHLWAVAPEPPKRRRHQRGSRGARRTEMILGVHSRAVAAERQGAAAQRSAPKQALRKAIAHLRK